MEEIKDKILNNVAFFWGPLDTPCWLWRNAPNHAGYGMISIDGKSFRVHRKSFEVFVGSIGVGLEIHHTCHIRHCCNPNHLQMMTHAEHMAITPNGGRGKRQTEKTHCSNGHEYTRENTYEWRGYRNGNPHRQCKTCAMWRTRQYRGVTPDRYFVPMAEKEFCKHGHTLTEENKYVTTRSENGSIKINCRECGRIARRKWGQKWTNSASQ